MRDYAFSLFANIAIIGLLKCLLHNHFRHFAIDTNQIDAGRASYSIFIFTNKIRCPVTV